MAKHYFLLVVGVVAVLGVTSAVFVGDIFAIPHENKDLIWTHKERLIIEEFKSRVSHLVPHEYMKEDVYLARWLKVNNFDLSRAENALMENLRWRHDFKMDEIQHEDFSDIKELCPAYVDTFARSGQPVVTSISRQCNLSQLFVSGKERRVLRYIFQLLDKASAMVRESYHTGNHITRFLILISMDGFNLAQHGCARCTFTFIDFIRLYERYFPDTIEKIVMINTPYYVQALFDPVVKAAISPRTVNSVQLKLLGTDRREWKPFLLDLIDEKELHVDFGGVRARHY